MQRAPLKPTVTQALWLANQAAIFFIDDHWVILKTFFIFVFFFFQSTFADSKALCIGVVLPLFPSVRMPVLRSSSSFAGKYLYTSVERHCLPPPPPRGVRYCKFWIGGK